MREQEEHVKKVKLLCQRCAYRRFLTLWIRSRTSRKFIPRSKTASAKVPRGGKYPRSESRYSAHKLTSAVTYMRCIAPLEEREISADKAMTLAYENIRSRYPTVNEALRSNVSSPTRRVYIYSWRINRYHRDIVLTLPHIYTTQISTDIYTDREKNDALTLIRTCKRFCRVIAISRESQYYHTVSWVIQWNEFELM